MLKTGTNAVEFNSPEIEHELEIERLIKEKNPDGTFKGGIVAEEIRGADGKLLETLVHIGNPYEDQPTIKTIATRCTKEEVEQIRSRILPTREAHEILTIIATAYEMRTPLILEGETAIGKTYLVNKFTELLYGKGMKPVDFYCSGQTDVSELMAKWVPRVDTAEEQKKWQDFIATNYGREKVAGIAKDLEAAGPMTEEAGGAMVQGRLQALAAEIGLSNRVQWELQLGCIPKALMGSVVETGEGAQKRRVLTVKEGGEGFILKIDEVGMAKPNVINALLKLRGENGRVADSIQLWENGGKLLNAGPGFWFVMNTNPPEKGYLDRNEVDPALARGAIWKRMGGLSAESLNLAADRYFAYKMGNEPTTLPRSCKLELHKFPEIGKEIGQIVATFHAEFTSALAKGETGGRQQKIPTTLDDMARLADYMLTSQVRSRATNLVDISETLRRGVAVVYTDRLADEKTKQLMTTALEKSLTDATLGVKPFRNGPAKTRKEIFDILVKEAMSKPVDSALLKKQEEEANRAVVEKARNGYEDQFVSTIKTLADQYRLHKEGSPDGKIKPNKVLADRMVPVIERLLKAGPKGNTLPELADFFAKDTNTHMEGFIRTEIKRRTAEESAKK